MKLFRLGLLVLMVAFFFTGITQSSKAQCIVPGAVDTLFPVVSYNVDPLIYPGTIYGVERKDDIYYMFGGFNYVSSNHGPALVMDSTLGKIKTPRRWMVNGWVNASIPDGRGGFYIGGNFSKVGDSVRMNFAHLNGNGQPTDLRLDADGEVAALYKKNDTIFLGGHFKYVNDHNRPCLAAYSIAGDSLLQEIPVFGKSYLANSFVKAITGWQDKLYVGGQFHDVYEIGIFNLLEVDLNNFSAKKKDYKVGNINRSVTAIDISDDGKWLVFSSQAGGPLIIADRVSGEHQHVVQIGPGQVETWEQNAMVIEIIGNNVFIGGTFDYIRTNQDGLKAIKGFFGMNLVSGMLLPVDLQLNGSVRYLARHKDGLYISGGFSKIGNAERHHFAILDTGSLALKSTQLSPSTFISTINFSGGNAFVGGYFNGINAVRRDGFVAIDAVTREILPIQSQKPDYYEIRKKARWGDTLFILGVTGPRCISNDATSLIAIRLSTGEKVEMPIGPSINDITIDGDSLFFLRDNNVGRMHIPSLTIDAWRRDFFSTFTPTFMIPSGDKIYVIGDWRRRLSGCWSDRYKGQVAILDRRTGNTLQFWAYDPSDPDHDTVYFQRAILRDSILYIQGIFSNLNGVSRHNFVAVNINTGSITDWVTDFVVPGSYGYQSSLDRVYLFTLHDNKIWLGTDALYHWNGDWVKRVNTISTVSGNLLPAIAELDSRLITNTSVTNADIVGFRDACFSESDLLVAGSFTHANDMVCGSILRFFYQASRPPDAIAGREIEGPDTLMAGPHGMKYFLSGTPDHKVYSWEFDNNGKILFSNNGHDSVLVIAPPESQDGHIKVYTENLCGPSAEISKKVVIGRVDLAMSKMNVSKDTLAGGDAFIFSFKEQNTGNMQAPPHKVRFYLSPDSLELPYLYRDEYYVGELDVKEPIAEGEAIVQTVNLLMNCKALSPGKGYLIAIIDYDRSVTETNEYNNLASVRIYAQSGMAAPIIAGFSTTPQFPCNEDSVKLTVDTTGCEGCSYIWNNGVSGTSIMVSTGTYIVTATNNCGSVSRAVNVSVPPPVNVNLSVADTVICEGMAVTLTASGGSNYLWEGAGIASPLNGSVVTVTPPGTGVVKYKVTTGMGTCIISDSVTLYIKPRKPSLRLELTGCHTNWLNIKANVMNAGLSPSYQWMLNNAVVTGNGPQMTLFKPDTVIMIKCQVISNDVCSPGATASDSIKVNCVTTGLPDIDGLLKFAVMPNPSNGLIKVLVKLNGYKQMRWEVIDSQGKTVYLSALESRTGEFTRFIHLEYLPSGVYYLRTSVDKTAFIQRIAITR